MLGTRGSRIEWKCQEQREVEQSRNVRNRDKQNRVEILGKERRRKECKSKKQRKVEYSGNVRNKEKKNRVEM